MSDLYSVMKEQAGEIEPKPLSRLFRLTLNSGRRVPKSKSELRTQQKNLVAFVVRCKNPTEDELAQIGLNDINIG